MSFPGRVDQLRGVVAGEYHDRDRQGAIAATAVETRRGSTHQGGAGVQFGGHRQGLVWIVSAAADDAGTGGG